MIQYRIFMCRIDWWRVRNLDPPTNRAMWLFIYKHTITYNIIGTGTRVQNINQKTMRYSLHIYSTVNWWNSQQYSYQANSIICRIIKTDNVKAKKKHKKMPNKVDTTLFERIFSVKIYWKQNQQLTLYCWNNLYTYI